MNERLLSEVIKENSYIAKHYIKVTNDLVGCDALIVSRKRLKEVKGCEIDYIGACNKYEKEAASYYRERGYNYILKLDHWLTSTTLKEPKALQLKHNLIRHLPEGEYERFIHHPKKIDSNFGKLYPHEYSLSSYPPDFVIFNSSTGDWRFVEVKSPNDNLSFRQANWYVNLMPDHWKFELFCLVNKDIENIFLKSDLPRKGGLFDDIYLEEIKNTDKLNANRPPVDIEQYNRFELNRIYLEEQNILFGRDGV